jgi:hypothetical protein
MKTFAQFLAEKEKIFTTFSGQSPGKAMASVVRPARPVKPFSGINVAKIFSKDGPARQSPGVMGK